MWSLALPKCPIWSGKEKLLGEYMFNFLIPTTIGNIIGGTGVFTLLIYGQVTEELEQ